MMEKDGPCLRDFSKRGDEKAFEAVVARHAGMVFRSARKILGQREDAEDVTQTVFLILARKAASFTHSPSVAPLLHRWVCDLSTDLLRARAARLARERRSMEMAKKDGAGKEAQGIRLACLEEELSRLPGRYRQALVLYHLEGMTRSQVAQILGCPEGTVGSWLNRGRALPQQRLRRRGIGLALPLLENLISAGSGDADLPKDWATATAQMAAGWVKGPTGMPPAALSPRVVSWAKERTRLMLMRKIACTAGIGFFVGWCGFLFMHKMLEAGETVHPI